MQVQIASDTSFNKKFYSDEYLNDLEHESSIMKINVQHYEKLFKLLTKNKDHVASLLEMNKLNIDECQCYGGGFPQLESFYPLSKLTIYDLIATQYRKHIKVFTNIYDTDGMKITYTAHDLLKGVKKTTNPTFVSFSHILEHFSFQDMSKIISSAANNLPDGSYGLIYQPNISAVKGKTWVHYNIQHLSFLPIDTFVKFINDFDELEVKVSMSYSDDLFILFRVCK